MNGFIDVSIDNMFGAFILGVRNGACALPSYCYQRTVLEILNSDQIVIVAALGLVAVAALAVVVVVLAVELAAIVAVVVVAGFAVQVVAVTVSIVAVLLFVYEAGTEQPVVCPVSLLYWSKPCSDKGVLAYQTKQILFPLMHTLNAYYIYCINRRVSRINYEGVGWTNIGRVLKSTVNTETQNFTFRTCKLHTRTARVP